jgi:hypothetical protein
MKYGSRLLGAFGVVMALLMTGCATEMTPKQKDAAELRRYCESNKNDPVKCLGFYGFL